MVSFCNISSAFAYKIQEDKFIKKLKCDANRMEEIEMTKKNIATMSEMEKVSGGMIYDPKRPPRPGIPLGGLASIPVMKKVPRPVQPWR